MRRPRLPRLPRLLALGYSLRRLLKEATAIRAELTRQNDLLARLVDHLAPETPPVDAATVRRETGVDVFDPIEGGLVLDFIARTEAEQGRPPTEDEILEHLADDATVDLHARLRQRELDRLRRVEEPS